MTTTRPTDGRSVIASTVRAEVARRSVRQRQIADALCLDQRAVSRRLLGRVEWSAAELKGLADLLQVPVGDLYAAPAEAVSA